jgi:hypothetical protein
MEPIASQTPQGTNTRRRVSLKRVIGHLTAVTDGALSFPAALVDGTGGDGRWQGLELINGTGTATSSRPWKISTRYMDRSNGENCCNRRCRG